MRAEEKPSTSKGTKDPETEVVDIKDTVEKNEDGKGVVHFRGAEVQKG